MQDEEAADARLRRQLAVDPLHLAVDELAHLRLLGEVHVAGVGDAVLLGPLAHRLAVNVDQGSHIGTVGPQGHRLLDVGAELELVLDPLGGEGGAVGQARHVLEPVYDDQLAVGGEEAGVAGAQPAVGQGLGGGLRVLEVALEDAGAPDQHLPLVGDAHLHPRQRAAHRVGAHLAVPLHRRQGRALGAAIDLL